MELRITPYEVPKKVQFNYDELKAAVTEITDRYAAVIYTDDQIKTAKADKADLNRLRKAINDERLRREKDYMKPFDEFKRQVNEILSLIDGAVAPIDAQVKDYDRRKKEEKRETIEELFKSHGFEKWLTLDMIFDPKWLNATTPMKKVEADIVTKLTQIDRELTTLEALPEFSFEAIEVYKQTLDITKAIAEGKRLADIQRRKEEAERAAAEKAAEEAKRAAAAMAENADEAKRATEAASQFGAIYPDSEKIPTEPVSEVKFTARMTVSQAVELRKWFKERDIWFTATV